MKHLLLAVLKWNAGQRALCWRHALAHCSGVVTPSTRSGSITCSSGAGASKLYSGPSGHGGSGVIVLELVDVELVVDVVLHSSRRVKYMS